MHVQVQIRFLFVFYLLVYITTAANTPKQAGSAKPSKQQPSAVATATTKTKTLDQTDDQLSQDIQGLGLSGKKGSQLNTPSNTPAETPRSGSPLSKIPASKRINVPEEYAKRTSDKPKLNLVVIGKFILESVKVGVRVLLER